MILVKLFGHDVGYLREDARQQIEFSYASEFLTLGVELSPLLLPLQEGVFTQRYSPTFKGLPEFIADAL
ncbi:MAG: HipA N-terminal domain-containing protein, partial [Thiomicrorhabdus sp.]|nr:HipA N-terminal domain-containing protein [Thiomicrorhabdus sp.]